MQVYWIYLDKDENQSPWLMHWKPADSLCNSPSHIASMKELTVMTVTIWKYA